MYARGEKVLLLEETRRADEPVWGTITYVQPDGFLQVEPPMELNTVGQPTTRTVTVTVAPENVAAIGEVVVSVTFLRELRHTLQRAGLRQ